MSSSRLLALGLCAVLVGCARPGPQDGGASGRRPDKARKDAEALALGAVTSAADAQAKALPAIARKPEPPPEQLREQRALERLPSAVRGLGGLGAVALAAFLFLRLDDRMQRKRTTALALVAGALAAGGVAAAVLV
jgi:hypothetical protein